MLDNRQVAAIPSGLVVLCAPRLPGSVLAAHTPTCMLWNNITVNYSTSIGEKIRAIIQKLVWAHCERSEFRVRFTFLAPH